MCLNSEGVVEVSIQVTHRDLGVRQAHAGRLIADFFTTGLAYNSFAALAFNTVGDIVSSSSVFRWAPGQEELPCTGGGHQILWGRGKS